MMHLCALSHHLRLICYHLYLRLVMPFLRRVRVGVQPRRGDQDERRRRVLRFVEIVAQDVAQVVVAQIVAQVIALDIGSEIGNSL